MSLQPDPYPNTLTTAEAVDADGRPLVADRAVAHARRPPSSSRRSLRPSSSRRLLCRSPRLHQHLS